MDGRPMWAYGGDFGPPGTPSDGIFCANGLTQPDGKLNPHTHEVAHVYSPIRIKAILVNHSFAHLRFTSERLFVALSLRVTWTFLEQGVERCVNADADK